MPSSSVGSVAEGTRGEGASAGVCLFCVGGHHFAVDTSAVGEVTTTAAVLPVPLAPVPVVGLFNLRGTPLAVVDLLVLLGLRPTPAQVTREGTTVMVVRTDRPIAALRVDRLEKVLPRDAGRRVLLDLPDVSRAQIGLFEPPDGHPAIPLLGGQPLAQALLALALAEAQSTPPPSGHPLHPESPRGP